MRTLPLAAALLGLAALLAAALLAIDSARAQLPPDLKLTIGLVDDSDDIVPPGGEASVRAELRFTGGHTDDRGGFAAEQLLMDCENLAVSGANLRLGGVGVTAWEGAGSVGRRLDIADQTFSLIKSADPADPIESPASVTTPRPSFVVKAVAGKYLAGTARGSGAAEDAETEPNTAHLINLCGAEVAKIDPPAGTAAGSFGGVTLPHTNAEDALDMWAEDADGDGEHDNLWLFIGSRLDAVDDRERVGRLHVYKADLSASPPTVTLETTLSPPSSEYLNKPGDDYPNYGHSVVVSGDGSTLAVSAPVMNGIGAVYVYSKPSGTGEDWGDITYANGVKVTPVETPAWGDWSSAAQIAATRPFNWLSASCDAYCMEVATLLLYEDAETTVYNGVGFGGYAGDHTIGLGHSSGLAISNDGTVLVVGAPYKAWARCAPAPLRNNFPGHQVNECSSGYFRGRVHQGAAFVFVAPSGGWTAAPDATTGQTEIAAGADASSFARASHYSPGPTRRIVDEDGTLVTNFPWGTGFFGTLYLGLQVSVTPDGSTVFVGSNTWHYGYTKASASAWDGGPRLVTGDYNYNPYPGTGALHGGVAISPDGTRLAMGNVGHSYYSSGSHSGRVCPLPDGVEDVGGRGGVYVFTRVGATWGGNANGSQTEVCSPQQAEGAHFGRSIHFTTVDSQVLMVVSEPYSDSDALLSRVWLLPLPGDTTTLTETRCRGELLDGVYTRTCPLSLPGSQTAEVPDGAPDGTFRITGQLSMTVGGGQTQALQGQFEGRIGVVREVAEARLDFAVNKNSPGPADDRPYPSSIGAGEDTVLRLQILNEHGKAAATGSVAEVLVQTTRGALSSLVEGGACAVSGQMVCRIPGSALTATNSGEALIKLEHKGRADEVGEARVWATVLGTEQNGAPGATLTTERVTVSLVGPAAELVISAPHAGVLSVNAESAEGAEQAGTDSDRRDELLLTVGALDEQGNAVPLPTPEPARTVPRRIDGLGIEVPPETAGEPQRQISRAHLTGPDGKRVTRGVTIVWPVGGTENPRVDAAGNEFVRVNVDRAADEPLASGEYTLELQLGSNLLGRQTFTVAGPPASLELSEPQGPLTVGDQFTVSATLADADGNPVPDGTPVEFSEQSAGTTSVVLVLLSQSEQRTREGRVSATLQAVGRGNAYVRAETGNVAEIQAITVAAAPPPPLDDAIAALAVDTYSIWTGPRATSAAELYDALEGVAQLSKWDGIEWLRYGETDGLLNSGSVDFVIRRGDVLWLDGE